jgi:hypothetical protein
MTDRALVLRRLARLLDALANAQQRRPPDVATLRADALLRDALDRFAQAVARYVGPDPAG